MNSINSPLPGQTLPAQPQVIDLTSLNVSQRFLVQHNTYKVVIEHGSSDLHFQRNGANLHISGQPQNLGTPPLIMENFYNHLPQLVQSATGQDGQDLTPTQSENISIVNTLSEGQQGKLSSYSAANGQADSALIPTIGGVFDALGKKQGLLNPGDETDDARPVITGTAEPGSLVTIYQNGLPWGYGYADADSNFRIEPNQPLFNGGIELTVAAEKNGSKVSGNEGFNLIVKAPPEAPSISDALDNIGSDTGMLVNNQITDDTRPELRGVAKPGTTLEIFDSRHGILGTAMVNSEGNWTFRPENELDQGKHIFTVMQTDETGRVMTSGLFSLVIEPAVTLLPEEPEQPLLPPVIELPVEPPYFVTTPTITGALDNNHEMALQDGSTSTDATPELSGTADPFALVYVLVAGQPIGSGMANEKGEWQFEVQAENMRGTHAFTAISIVDEQLSEFSNPWVLDIRPEVTVSSDYAELLNEPAEMLFMAELTQQEPVELDVVDLQLSPVENTSTGVTDNSGILNGFADDELANLSVLM